MLKKLLLSSLMLISGSIGYCHVIEVTQSTLIEFNDISSIEFKDLEKTLLGICEISLKNGKIFSFTLGQFPSESIQSVKAMHKYLENLNRSAGQSSN